MFKVRSISPASYATETTSQASFRLTVSAGQQRFHAWGLWKYGPRGIVQHNRPGGSACTFIHHHEPDGRLGGRRRSQARLRAPSGPEKHELVQLPPARRLSAYHSLDAPDDHRCAEVSTRAAFEYMQYGFKMHKWDMAGEYNFEADMADDWWTKIRFAAQEMKKTKVSTGFRLVHKYFDVQAALLRRQDPMLGLVSVVAFVELSSIDDRLGQSLLRYVPDLCHIQLGPAHPFTRLWGSLRSLGFDGARKTSGSLVDVYFHAVARYTPAANRFWSVARLQATCSLSRCGAISGEFAGHVCRQIIEEMGRSCETAEDSSYYWWARCSLSKLLTHAGRYQEAYDAILPVETYYAVAENQGNDVEHYKLKAEILTALGRYEEARPIWIQFYHTACQWTKSSAPYYLTCSSFGLEDSYRKLGEVEAADNFRRDCEVYFDSLLESGRINKADRRRLPRRDTVDTGA